ncbi:hypothetical protein [[Eubacterium] cellulosolvens]
MKKYISFGLVILALILVILSVNLPWWSQSAKIKENDYQLTESYGLTEIRESQEQTEDQYSYLCPHCGNTIAYDDNDLEDEKSYYCSECGDYIADDAESLESHKRYYCPDCGEVIGYGYEELDDLKVYCPECGNWVGRDATECSGWDGCGATFSEPVVWCSNCDKAIIPKKGVYCYNCDKIVDTELGYHCWDCENTFDKPDKEKSANKGDRYDMAIPYSNYQLTEPKEEYGVENKVNVGKTTFYLILITLIFSVLAIVAFPLYYRKRGKLSGKVALPLVFTLLFFIFILITPVYFAAAWGGALNADYKDKVDALVDEDNPYADKPEQIVKGFMGSKSVNKTSPEFYYGVYSTEEKVEYNWAPALGWYLTLIAMILVLIALILIFIMRKRLAATVVVPPLYPHTQAITRKPEVIPAAPGVPPTDITYHPPPSQPSPPSYPSSPPPPPTSSYEAPPSTPPQGYSEPRTDRGQAYDFGAMQRDRDHEYRYPPPRQEEKSYYNYSVPEQQQQDPNQYSNQSRGQYYPPQRRSRKYYDRY